MSKATENLARKMYFSKDDSSDSDDEEFEDEEGSFDEECELPVDVKDEDIESNDGVNDDYDLKEDEDISSFSEESVPFEERESQDSFYKYDDDTSVNTSPEKKTKLSFALIKSHLKGSLSFGLPSSAVFNGHEPKTVFNFKNKINVEAEHLSDELQMGYRILAELLSPDLHFNAPFLLSIELNMQNNKDYLSVISQPLWLPRIKENLLNSKYSSISELVRDIRLMLENTYRYYGALHAISKKALRLEHFLEECLSCLPDQVKEKCSLRKTGFERASEEDMQKNKSARININGGIFFSNLLCHVRGCRLERIKDAKRKKLEAMHKAKAEKKKEEAKWDDILLVEPLKTQMRAMWEFPQIGLFIFLALRSLNIYEVPQYELERCLAMPAASKTLSVLMTSLLSSPQQRLKIGDKPYMPYSIWTEKLAQKVRIWYKCFNKENGDVEKVYEQTGIEPFFWKICDEKNPFSNHLFHELTFYQRVWLLKSLCDYVHDVIAEQSEVDLREIVLGKDREGNSYMHFPQFCGQDIRIYRSAPLPYPEYEFHVKEEKVKAKPTGTRLFSKEKLKEFKVLLKKLKKKTKVDVEWEGSRRRRKRRRPKINFGFNEINRSRPGNLRQLPKTQYTFDDGYSSDGGEVIHYKYSREVSPDSKSLSSSDSDVPVPHDKVLVVEKSEEQNVYKKPRKVKRQKKCCKVCKKTFSTANALYGHTAIHYKKKTQESVREEETVKANGVASSEASSENSLQPVLVNEEDGKIVDDNSGNKIKEELAENIESTVPFLTDIKEPNDCPLKQENASKSDFEIMEEKLRELDSLDPNSPLNNKIKVETPLENTNHDANDHTNGKINEEESNNSFPDIKNGNTNLLCIENQKKQNCNGSIKEECHSDISLLNKENMACKDEFGENIQPNINDFELVVSSIDDLRQLILKFGGLPKKHNSKERLQTKKLENEVTEDKNEEEGIHEKQVKSLPHCERRLYASLCHLFNELLPWETKLLQATKKMRNKMRNEYFEWENRKPDYVDPAEEAWLSDPEPEPEPLAPPVESSEHCSPSEDSYDDEGNRKRKLRKRKAKKQAIPAVETTVPEEKTNIIDEDTSETFSISSRGRIRKVKKIVNYDDLDFEELANQAVMEKQEREAKKRLMKEAQKEKYSSESELDMDVPTCGVRRYLLSHTGQMIGFIDNNGQVHSGQFKKKDASTEESAVKNNEHSSFYAKTSTNADSKSDLPTVTVTALRIGGQNVQIRVIGHQALQLVGYMKPGSQGPASQIKLQHGNQTFVVDSNAHIITKNIPGFPDGDTRISLALSKKVSIQNGSKQSEKIYLHTNLVSKGNATVSKATVSSFCCTSNTIALAYQGIPSLTPSQTHIGKKECASLSVGTNLVSTISSVIPSVLPIVSTVIDSEDEVINKPSIATPLPRPIAFNTKTIAPSNSSLISPLKSVGTVLASPSNVINNSQTTTSAYSAVVSGSDGTQFKLLLDSNSASQLLQKQGKLMIVPNSRGNYVLSLSPGESAAPTQPSVLATQKTVMHSSTTPGNVIIQQKSPDGRVVHLIHNSPTTVRQRLNNVAENESVSPALLANQNIILKPQVNDGNLQETLGTTAIASQQMIMPSIQKTLIQSSDGRTYQIIQNQPQQLLTPNINIGKSQKTVIVSPNQNVVQIPKLQQAVVRFARPVVPNTNPSIDSSQVAFINPSSLKSEVTQSIKPVQTTSFSAQPPLQNVQVISGHQVYKQLQAPVSSSQQQVIVASPQNTSPQVFLLKTNQGERVGIQHPDGRISLLAQQIPLQFRIIKQSEQL